MKVYVVADMSAKKIEEGEIHVPVWTATFDSLEAAMKAVVDDVANSVMEGMPKHEFEKIRDDIVIQWFGNQPHFLGYCDYNSSTYSVTEATHVLSHDGKEESRIIRLNG